MDQSFLPDYRKHLRAEWGERGDAIFQALLADHRKLARVSGFASGFTSGAKTTYHMDPASLLPALALDVQPGMEVLDLCAAPGGKTLILAESLFLSSTSGQGRLVANEISDGRRTRLKNTIRDYVPPEFQERIRVTGYDASRWGLNEKEAYDRILVDAPCSGDRFFLKKLHNQQLHESDAEEIEDFRPGRSKRLAIRQYAILASAWMALKPGGRLVYSTCAVSEVENDKVVAKLIKRQGVASSGEVALTVDRELSGKLGEVSAELQMVCEPTAHGFIVLPDRSGGAGPIYFSILNKL